MADPITLGMTAVSAGTSLASSLLGAAGSQQAGEAGSQASMYNAIIAMQRAKLATEQAATESSRVTVAGANKAAQVSAAFGQGNIDTTTGSTKEVLDEMDVATRLDAMTAVYTGQVRATGYANDATLAMNAAQNQKIAASYGSATRILGGLADVYKIGKGLKLGGDSSSSVDV